LSSSPVRHVLEQLSGLPSSDRVLLAGQCPGLLDYLARVPDPRGVRHTLTPDEATIRRVLETVDAGALDAAVGSWLDAQLRLRAAGQGPGHGRRARRAVAVDGKAVRGTRHTSIAAACRHHARDATRTLATLGLSPP